MVAFQERRHEDDRREKDKYEFVCTIHGVLSYKDTHYIANQYWCGECLEQHFLEHSIVPTNKRLKK